MNNDITFGIIGRIDDSLYDGQTVKTRTLVTALREYYPNCNILVAESNISKRKPFKLLHRLLSCVRKADVIFVLLSRNGLRILLPILFFLNRFYHKPIIHDCIGGAHDETIRLYPSLKKYYCKMDVNWVETESLRRKLEQEGVTNVSILPNFKNIHPISVDAVQTGDTAPYRFCTFSRVNEKKGIGLAAEAVLAINEAAGFMRTALDVYGPIEDNFDIALNDYISRSNGAITYCGVASPEDSVSILQRYYGLLFPTQYVGEGIAGTLIDALCSALPVISTAQPGVAEVISHGKTGYLYAPDHPEKLREWMEYAMSHEEEFHNMRFVCLESVKSYSREAAMETVCETIRQVTANRA